MKEDQGRGWTKPNILPVNQTLLVIIVVDFVTDDESVESILLLSLSPLLLTGDRQFSPFHFFNSQSLCQLDILFNILPEGFSGYNGFLSISWVVIISLVSQEKYLLLLLDGRDHDKLSFCK